MNLLLLLPLPALVIASAIDIQTRKIPNYITFPFMTMGLVFTIIFNNVSVMNCVFGMALMFSFGMLGLAGMGDIKLLMVIASVSGFAMTILTAGIAAVLLLIFKLFTNYESTKRAMREGINAVIYGNLKILDRTGERFAFAIYITISYVLVVGGVFVCSLV